MPERKKAEKFDLDDELDDTPTPRRNTSRKSAPERSPRKLKDETRHTVLGVVFIALSLFFIIAGFGAGGPAGTSAKKLFTYLFGVGYALVPTLFAVLGVTFMKKGRPEIAFMHALGSLMFLVGTLGLINIATTTAAGETGAAGVVGMIVSYPFVALFATLAAILFLGAVLIISIVILFDTRPNMTLFMSLYGRLLAKWHARLERRKKDHELVISGDHKNDTDEEEEIVIPAAALASTATPKPEPIPEEPKEPIGDLEDFKLEAPKKPYKPAASYVPPPITLLASDKGKPNVGDVKANANIIKRSLSNFGIEVEMDEVTIGPSVTRYAFKPAEGVKLSRILGLQNDLALALAAHPIRIEAPIPGKSLVGIEIPNKGKSTVGLANLLAEDTFARSEKPLTVALGRSINGTGLMANMAKMPHVLIAGATGSGKSVTIHAFITSLLYRNGPEDLRFIMIDPKRVELTLYNKIPHLLTPVITDAKKAILSLKWAAKEMDRRYDVLQKVSVRDIDSYHKNILGKNKGKRPQEGEDMPEQMPYIVIIIDELADIMQAYPRELESAIVRLAQMSRAVGIHLLLSTQRPSVNVITGLIKANVPARVALQVASQIDSRTILDQAGAEKLLGAGDMLFLAGDTPQPIRLQSAFISEAELKSIVSFIAENNDCDGVDEIALTGSVSADKNMFETSLEGGESEDDELYEDARMTVIEAGKASTSFLQRKLGVGYARAARLIDMLEDRGVIGPGSGAKPRDVLIKSGDGIMDEPA